MNQYLFKMFEEFKKAYGIKDTIDNFSKYLDLFANWIISKRDAATNYVQLFDYMEGYEENPTCHMAEFGKGIYDTITIAMTNNTNHKPIVISPFAKTITKENKIPAFTGKLSVSGDNVIVKYSTKDSYYTYSDCYPLFNGDVGTFMIQAPYSKEELYPFLKLADSNKTLFIGAFGSLKDWDYEDNLQEINNLYQQLCTMSYRNVNFCSETQKGFYFSAIKISSKGKALKKTKSYRYF